MSKPKYDLMYVLNDLMHNPKKVYHIYGEKVGVYDEVFFITTDKVNGIRNVVMINDDLHEEDVTIGYSEEVKINQITNNLDYEKADEVTAKWWRKEYNLK